MATTDERLAALMAEAERIDAERRRIAQGFTYNRGRASRDRGTARHAELTAQLEAVNADIAALFGGAV